VVENTDGSLAEVFADLEDWVDEDCLVGPYWRLELDRAGLLEQGEKGEFEKLCR